MTTNLHLVPFHEDILYLIDHDGQPYVPVRPINDALGIHWQAQTEKLSEDRWKCTVIRTVAADGKQREMLCLPLRKLPAWLYSISPAKVREDIRPKLEQYQEECDEVLWKYWSEGAAVNPRAVVPPARDFPSHAADRLVAAGRTFREALRSARALGLPKHEAVRKANEAASRHTGLNVLDELGVAAPEPPVMETFPDPADPSAFLQEWLAGRLPVPCCICRSVDLHRAYRVWCRLRGVNPCNIKSLVRAAKTIDYRISRKLWFLCPDGKKKQASTIVPPGGIKPGSHETIERLATRQVNRFVTALMAWEEQMLPGGDA